VKYNKEIIAGCTAGLLFSALLTWKQWQEQDASFTEATRLQVHALSRLAQSQLKTNRAIALPPRRDSWGTPLTFAGTQVCSHGPDRRAGTADDICAP
jgi:hypothetical protein